MAMNKKLKAVLSVIGILVLALIVALIFVPGLVIRTTTETVGSKLLGVEVEMESCSLNWLSAELDIKDFKIDNPENYDSDKEGFDYAFSVGDVYVDIDESTFFSDVLIIDSVLIVSPEIAYVRKDGKSNFDVIMANLGVEQSKEKQEEETKKEGGKKVIIRKVSVTGTRFHADLPLTPRMTLPVFAIELNNIGGNPDDPNAKAKGVDFASAISEITAGILNGADSAGDGTQKFCGNAMDSFKKAGGAIGDWSKETWGAASENASKAWGATKESTEKALDGAKDTLKDAGDAVKGIFK